MLVIVAAAYALVRVIGVGRLAEQDAEGIGALLQIIGTLYSVLYAFATYVIWGQFSAVESEILKEAGALKSLLRFSQRLNNESREPIVRAVKTYVRGVVETEWPALSNREDTANTDKLFSEVVSSVTAVKPTSESERLIYDQLLEIINQASAHRDERIAVSLTRIPKTLLTLVTLTAFTILLLVLVYPFRNLPLGLASMLVTTTLVYLAHFVLTDLDNPFEGTWNVTPDRFGVLINRFE